jgi:hypothetical protein
MRNHVFCSNILVVFRKSFGLRRNSNKRSKVSCGEKVSIESEEKTHVINTIHEEQILGNQNEGNCRNDNEIKNLGMKNYRKLKIKA